MNTFKLITIKTKKYNRFINLNSNFTYFNIKQHKLNKKFWNIIFKKKTNVKVNAIFTIKLNFKKLNKLDLKYNSIKTIENSFLKYKEKKASIVKINFNHENQYNFLNLNLLLTKEILFTQLNKKKQYIFFLKDFISNLLKDSQTLYLNDNIITNQLVLQSNKCYNLKNTKKNNVFFNKYLNFVLFGFQNNFHKIDIKHKIFNSTLKPILINYYINNYFLINLTSNKKVIVSKNELEALFLFLNLNLKHWFNNYKSTSWHFYLNDFLAHNWKKSSLINSPKLLLRKNKYKSFLKGKNFIDSKILHHFKLKIQKDNKIKTIIQINKDLWKNSNYIGNKNFVNKILSFIPFKRNFNYINGNNVKNKAISKHLIYLLTRLEDKIDLLVEVKNSKAIILLKLYNYLKTLIIKKNFNLSIENSILCNGEDVLNIKKNNWKVIFKAEIEKLIKKDNNGKNLLFAKKILETFKNLTLDLKNKISNKNNALENTSRKWLNKTNEDFNFVIPNKNNNKTKNEPIKPHFKFTDKIYFKNSYTKINDNKNALGLLINKKINIFFINSLALTKYGFNLQRRLNEKQKRNPTLYLQNLDRDMINKYKYIGIYIKDLIRVCFIGMFLKKPNFIAKFIAFQLAKLPRNRKETQFIKFIITVVKTFAAEREEITGLRIKFKGRVNRWRRTKSIIGERGILPLHKFDTNIEYGTSYAINKKGTLGIRLWIRYNPNFIYKPKPWINFNYSYLAKESIFRYIKYSQKQQKILDNVKLLAYKNRIKSATIDITHNNI